MSNGTDPNEGIEHIQIIPDSEHHWNAAVGPEAMNLLGHLGLPQQTAESLRNEAVSILSRGVPPIVPEGQETGLVVGYVQSGKTMSFTTVSALARDNGYPIVIVIAGTSVPLTEQSRRRLRADLRLEIRTDRQWRHFHNPRTDNQDHVRIATALADWRDADVPPEERCTVLITVMKHHGHLNHLTHTLGQVDLTGIPVLIVDDEADQAGLNNLINEGEESTTYQRLCALKSAIPHHTFLQYTATPQGPLLINLIDVLSPNFAVTLTPGPDYTGGRDFFLNEASLIREIPPDDLPTRNNPLHTPPESLLHALRLFFLGVASGIIHGQGPSNRSMMVHPSQRTAGHQGYFDWVSSVRDAWLHLLDNPNDPDYQDLVAAFHHDYADLQATVPDLPAFEQLMGRMRHAVRRTDIHLVNSVQGATPQIDWRGAYSHILVGGQALDRGFTVEGLTVTYMPRGVGTRRADTIQQRARFFGYKRPYLGYCRIFLEQEVADAFRRYVRHEEDVRRQLSELAAQGRSLNELRRMFLLPRGLHPTRDSIIDIDYVRARVNEGWFYPKSPHDSADAVQSNRDAVIAFLDSLDLQSDVGHADRSPIQQHQYADDVPLRDAYEQLLLSLRFTRLSDAQDLLGVLLIIRSHLDENPGALCTVYQMSSGTPRVRTVDENGVILNLFQGAAPVNPPERRGEVYPGDRFVRTDDRFTLQIHTLNLRERGSTAIVHPDIPNIAVWIPEGLSSDILVQDQGGIDEFEDE